MSSHAAKAFCIEARSGVKIRDVSRLVMPVARQGTDLVLVLGEKTMDAVVFIVGIIGAIAFGAIGAALANSKDAAGAGFWCGFFLGPVGLLIAALALDFRPQCPACKTHVDKDASVCPQCRNVLNSCARTKKCPACNTLVTPETTTCPHCRSVLQYQPYVERLSESDPLYGKE
jgi:hypothetical protein